jgi:hypothetical protein
VIQQQFNAHKCAPADGGQAGSKSS